MDANKQEWSVEDKHSIITVTLRENGKIVRIFEYTREFLDGYAYEHDIEPVALLEAKMDLIGYK